MIRPPLKLAAAMLLLIFARSALAQLPGPDRLPQPGEPFYMPPNPKMAQAYQDIINDLLRALSDSTTAQSGTPANTGAPAPAPATPTSQPGETGSGLLNSPLNVQLDAIRIVISNVDPNVTQALADSVNRMGQAMVDVMEQQAAAAASKGAPAAPTATGQPGETGNGPLTSPLNVQLNAIRNVLSNVDPNVTQALADSVNRMGQAMVDVMEQQAAAAANKGAPAQSATFKNSAQSFGGLSEEGVQSYGFPPDTSPANTATFNTSTQSFGAFSDADLRALGFPPDALPANTTVFKNSAQSFGTLSDADLRALGIPPDAPPANTATFRNSNQSFGSPDPGIDGNFGNGMPEDSMIFLVGFDTADNLASNDGFETSQALAMYRELSTSAGADSPLAAQNLQTNYSIAVARMPPASGKTAPGLPNAVPSLQISVPSSQIQMPSDVMTSLDLQPSLCGR